MGSEHFAGGGDFETFRHRLLRFTAFGSSHNQSILFSKRAGNIETTGVGCTRYLRPSRFAFRAPRALRRGGRGRCGCIRENAAYLWLAWLRSLSQPRSDERSHRGPARECPLERSYLRK
jgi:hypothetical protein